MSYFENIPSLQFSANALTVAHVIVSIFQNICVENVGHTHSDSKVGVWIGFLFNPFVLYT